MTNCTFFHSKYLLFYSLSSFLIDSKSKENAPKQLKLIAQEKIESNTFDYF